MKKIIFTYLIMILLFSSIACQQTQAQIVTYGSNQNQNQNQNPSSSQTISDNLIKNPYHLNKTVLQRSQQRQQQLKILKEYNHPAMMSSFAFEIVSQYQQFHFHLPTDHDVFFNVKIYVLIDNTYNIIQDVDKQPILSIVVYENNHRIIVEKSLYFQGLFLIHGKAGCTYMIRFFSPKHKMMIVRHNNFIQTSHLQDKVKSNQLQSRALKMQGYNNRLLTVFRDLRLTHLMQAADRNHMNQRMDKFMIYQIMQILIMAAVSFLQITLISKLFKTQTIV